MDRMNFYKCNLIFIGLVRVQGLTYSFHKSFILDTRYLTLKSLLFIPPFLFSENNMKRTFFIQDLECGTIESDIFLPCLEYTFLLFFAIRIIHQRGVVLYSKILQQCRVIIIIIGEIEEKQNAKRKRLRTLHLKKKIVVIKSRTTIAVASEQKRQEKQTFVSALLSSLIYQAWLSTLMAYLLTREISISYEFSSRYFHSDVSVIYVVKAKIPSI